MKRIVLTWAVMALLVGALAVPAFAVAPQKEVPGKSEQGTEQARSICAFSGLNDDPLDPEEGGLVQSYGQGVSQGALDPTDKETVERPGVLCNAHKFPYPEGFGEETP